MMMSWIAFLIKMMKNFVNIQLNKLTNTIQKLSRLDKKENNQFQPYKKEKARYFEVMGKSGDDNAE